MKLALTFFPILLFALSTSAQSVFGTPDKNGEIKVPFPMHYVIDRDGKIVLKEQGVIEVEAVRNELK